MKRSATHRSQVTPRMARFNAEKARTRAYDEVSLGEDTFDDRVSEDIYDLEGEDEEVAMIVQGMKHTSH